MKTIEQLAKEMKEKMTKMSPISAYEIAAQIYNDEAFAIQETHRAGWRFAGYDQNGEKVYTR